VKEEIDMAICLSHGGRTMYASDSPSNDLLVATADGLFWLQKEGKSWKASRRSLEGHHVSSIVIEPTTRAILAGMHNGGMAVSEDSGKTWDFRNSGMASDNVFCVNTVTVGGRVKIYAGTEPAHLYVSEDMGKSWNELSSLRSVPSVSEWTFPAPPHVAHVKNVDFDPFDPNIMYACVEQGTLLKSVDAGSSWSEVKSFNDFYKVHEGDAHRLMIRLSDPKKMFITTGFGLFRTLDGGQTLENISDRVSRIGYPDPIVQHPKNDNLLFVVGAENNPGTWIESKSANPRMARSRDGGETWELLGRGMPDHLKANFEAMTLEAWDGSCAVYAGNTDGEVYASEDEGESWSRIAEGLPPISKWGHYMLLFFANQQR
jgi:photosystem II stability/assembly factor-like uncharacterized protein